MRHKTIQFILAAWGVFLVICLALSAVVSGYIYNQLRSAWGDQQLPFPGNAAGLSARSWGSLYFLTLLPLIVFAVLFLGAVLLLCWRLLADISSAASTARYILDHPAADQNTLLPLDRSGETSGLQAAIEDLGARARFAIKHQKDSKIQLKDYLSDISHQLKTPLASLKLYNDLLERGPDLPAEDRGRFTAAQASQIRRMEWLITNLMKLARLDADTVIMNPEILDLRQTVRQAIEPFWERARREGKLIQIRCSQDLMLKHDRNWVAEALGNLVKNALEHTSAGCTIELRCSETPLTVQIDVNDDGEGVEPEDLPHIFERFYGRRNALNPDSVGIGLSLTRMILAKNDADIYCESNPGRGARFHIIFMKPIAGAAEYRQAFDLSWQSRQSWTSSLTEKS